MSRAQRAKEWFLRTALSYLGTPYIWGGDDPSGFDCSGFAIECLKSVGVLKESDDYTANGLLSLLHDRVTEKPVGGALLFFLNEDGKAVHVTVCLDEWFQIGASNGGSAVRSEREAWRANAYVKIRPINFRPGRMRVVTLFD
ncbi:MAG: C40 family peptidase [Candidatus Zixiibacteriota bacterium]|nr:MAG: C40 family peptidase [candidate division Zixibacteria bacterium]